MSSPCSRHRQQRRHHFITKSVHHVKAEAIDSKLTFLAHAISGLFTMRHNQRIFKENSDASTLLMIRSVSKSNTKYHQPFILQKHCSSTTIQISNYWLICSTLSKCLHACAYRNMFIPPQSMNSEKIFKICWHSMWAVSITVDQSVLRTESVDREAGINNTICQLVARSVRG